VHRRSQKVCCIAHLKLQPQAMTVLTDNKCRHKGLNCLNPIVAIQQAYRSRWDHRSQRCGPLLNWDHRSRFSQLIIKLLAWDRIHRGSEVCWQNSCSGQLESRSHFSNSEHAYGEIADLILALTILAIGSGQCLLCPRVRRVPRVS